jgi:hypothetical protein
VRAAPALLLDLDLDLDLERFRRWRRQLGHERQVERERCEQGDRRGCAVDAEEPLAGTVEVEPDLTDGRTDDQYRRCEMPDDRPDP